MLKINFFKDLNYEITKVRKTKEIIKFGHHICRVDKSANIQILELHGGDTKNNNRNII